MTTMERKAKQAREDLSYYRMVLRHLEERLAFLTPGVNTTLKNYMDLVDEKRELTRRAIGATIKGYDKVPDQTSLRLNSIIVHPLGGTYRTRSRADS